MAKTEYRTSDGWLSDPEFKGIKVLDPDGWDRSRLKESWAEVISKKEFNSRLMASTIQRVPR